MKSEFKGTNTKWRVGGIEKTEVLDQHGAFIADCSVSINMIGKNEQKSNCLLIANSLKLLRFAESVANIEEGCAPSVSYMMDLIQKSKQVVKEAVCM